MTGPSAKYDSKCLQWDKFYFVGNSPTGAAHNRPGHWQLVYELRPLELIPYWLGIPFKPHHPVYAVIYDDVNLGYYTASASKVTELGRPTVVRGAFPLARLLQHAAGVARVFQRVLDLAYNGFNALLRIAERCVDFVESHVHVSRVA